MGTMITAHSGSDGTPDNSLEFVRYALSTGADALEVDIHADGRGEFYISHDATQEPRPSLHEVFALLKTGRQKINCDLKDEGIEQGVLALAEVCGVRERVLFSGSVSPRQLSRDAALRACTFLNLECAVPELAQRADSMPTGREIAAAAKACKQCGAQVVNVHYSVCTEENLAVFQAYGIRVSAWTVDDPREAQRLLQAGLYNLTTRTPALLCQLREAQKD